MSAPARLMRGAVCERIVLERGSILSVRAGGGPAVLVRVTDLRAGQDGDIDADLARLARPAGTPSAPVTADRRRTHIRFGVVMGVASKVLLPIQDLN